ncbi:hypothetical protein [Sphingomonas sp.]|uniref:hypothetical protein n=1 Tax=Sphingomonas sp. TaxID=28214 RepID=UPI0031DB635D
MKRAGAVVNSPAVVEIALPDGTYITPPAYVPVDKTAQVLGSSASPVTVTGVTTGFREAFQLASGNTASSPATLFGGAYVLTQGCTTYGTVTLRYRGPDGVTMIGMVSKTAADSGGGTVVSFGGGAIVDVSLSGTAGCNVALSRVPQ